MSDFTNIQAEINRLASKIADAQITLVEPKLVVTNVNQIGKVVSFQLINPDDNDPYNELRIQRKYRYEDDKDIINELDEDIKIRNKLYRENVKESSDDFLDDWIIQDSYSDGEDEEDED